MGSAFFNYSDSYDKYGYIKSVFETERKKMITTIKFSNTCIRLL